jgi:methylated-DNA-[protein]-cysteine S-methyltransferase
MRGKHPECLAIETDLVATATGEAAWEAARRVRDHVDGCRPCRDELDRYRAIEGVVARMRGTSVSVTDGGEARARARLDASLSELRRRRITYGVFPSPLGHILIARSEDGVSLIDYLGDVPDVRASRLGRVDVETVEDTTAVEAFYRELLEYLEGRRTHLDWPLDLRLARSEFHRRVLRATAGVPYGAVRSYVGIASEVGRPTASRAVAQALRWNPLPIVVPCHRVVGASGAMVGYAGDKVDLKRRLLAVEGVVASGGSRLSRRAMYLTMPGESFYCLPTCAWIPTAPDPHRFMFFGRRERAEAAGLTPCSDCRPDLYPLAS